MEQSKILKRAWQILWSYRALWIFGMILALTTASVAQGSMVSNDSSGHEREGVQMELDPNRPILPQIQKAIEEDWERDNKDMDRLFKGDHPDFEAQKIFNIVMAVFVVLLVLLIVFRVLRYVAETSLIKMVDDNEERGDKVTVRQGFRLGWSRTSWRLFLIEVVINWPTFIAFIALFVLALSPLYPMVFGDGGESVLPVVFAIGLFFITIFLAIAVSALLSFLKPLIRREAVLAEAGVFAAIRQGFSLAKAHLKDAGLMWLILIGIDLLWSLLIIPVALLLLPVGILLGVGTALLVTLIPAVIWETPLVIAAVGIPIFLVILALPLIFLAGLREVFKSSSWTLTYRELTAMNGKPLDDPLGQLPGAEVNA